jgi:predicted metal-dependent peptidase
MDGHLVPAVSPAEAKHEALRAAETARKMRGTVPGGVEDALKELEKPTLTWQDIVRHACMRKKMDEGNKNDWKRLRRRWLHRTAPPQYLPRKHTHKPRILAGLDCSGSMSADDIVYCVSQLQVLGNEMDLTIVPWDSMVYWNKAVKVSNIGDLKKTKVVGRGGTTVSEFFTGFPKHMGREYDCIVMMTDGYIEQIDPGLKPPMDVCWIICNGSTPNVPFGRVAPLRHGKM